MKLSTLETGFFLSDGGAMFGLLPKMNWQRQYPADNKNLCKMAMRCLLVETKNKIILLDTGIGTKNDPGIAGYGFFDIVDPTLSMQLLGIRPEEVTDVILSHLHFDHCGGISYLNEKNELCESYPNATYHIAESQWKHSLNPAPFDADSYFPQNTALLIGNPRLHLIRDTYELTPDITLKIYNGHTPGQIVTFIEKQHETHLFAGDVIPTLPNLRIDSISAFDLHAETSFSEKNRLLHEAMEKNATLFFYHDAWHKSSRICTTPLKKMRLY
ncbi:MAG: MBL fold metallo-hydrolase [Bacteroidales bacterium]